MKNKTWTLIAFYTMLIGWFPYMWLAIYGSWHRTTIGISIAILGLGVCLFGTMMMLPLLKNNDLFKSKDELDEERLRYYQARKQLEQKILNL